MIQGVLGFWGFGVLGFWGYNGYSDNLAIFASNPPLFGVSNMVGGGGGGRGGVDERERPTGRGTADDPDIPQGRTPVEIPEEPHGEMWEATPLTSEQLRNPVNVIPPAARPRVVLRYANNRDLLVSGLLDNGSELAQHAAVIDGVVGPGPRGAVLEQSLLASGNEGELFPGVQCDSEFR